MLNATMAIAVIILNGRIQVIELALATKTVASTCHASALLPFYERKEVVKTFIMCTDEEENTNIMGKDSCSYRFQPLFAKYCKEVYNAKVVFVSFLRHQHAKGQMFEPMKADGFDVMQFKLDSVTANSIIILLKPKEILQICMYGISGATGSNKTEQFHWTISHAVGRSRISDKDGSRQFDEQRLAGRQRHQLNEYTHRIVHRCFRVLSPL